MKTNKELAIDLLKEIVQKEYSVSIDFPNFTTWCDWSGQRYCKLAPLYSYNLDIFPICLGVIRKGYDTFYQKDSHKDSFYKGGTEVEFYLKNNKQNETYIGQIIIEEKDLDQVSVQIGKTNGFIKFNKLTITYIASK